jgi:hypothetical protein
MRSLLLLAATMVCPLPALAGDAALSTNPGLQRNGALSRHVWQPEFAQTDIGGMRLSAGMAIGLRGAVRTNLDRSVSPALVLGTGRGESLSLLPARDGAMLVWQSAR